MKALEKLKIIKTLGGIIIGVFIILSVIFVFCTEKIESGHVGVATLFGKVQSNVYEEGLNVVNPLLSFTHIDIRQKTHKECMGVPSKDQLITKFELSIQYKAIKNLAPTVKKETGTPEDVIKIHLLPNLRSQMREIGKSVDRAENFYKQIVQQRIQTELYTGLSAHMVKKGIKIEKVLVRDVILPKIITNAVMRKKEAAQAAEKAKEELKKFKVDQERKEAQAEAEKKAEIIQAEKKSAVMLISANAKLEAAKIEAEAILVKAQAEAESKRKIIAVVGKKEFVQLKMINGLVKLQNGNHLIFLDGKGSSPLPFMNLDKMLK